MTWIAKKILVITMDYIPSDTAQSSGNNKPTHLGIHSHTGITGRLNVSIDKFHHQDWRTERTDGATPSPICIRQSQLT